ncbi:hypothetical protein K8R33_02395 [archaeon]|nr:hypothetical protein [archaeon]
MKKDGGIWVSAILYIAMGVVLLTVVLAAGLPAINKMKDSYTSRQTKDLMITLDNNIRNVFHEGPGSQRIVSINIGRGDFIINEGSDEITWELESSAIISEIGQTVNEGNLKILTQKTGVKDKYEIYLTLDYDAIGLDIVYTGPQKLSGDHKFSILNKGEDPIQIAITQL